MLELAKAQQHWDSLRSYVAAIPYGQTTCCTLKPEAQQPTHSLKSTSMVIVSSPTGQLFSKDQQHSHFLIPTYSIVLLFPKALEVWDTLDPNIAAIP